MRRHHTGSGRRPVIPADWADHHTAIIDSAIETSGTTITIGPAAGGAPVFDPDLGYSVTPAATPVYSGPAEVMAVSDTDRRLVVAEDDVTTRVYRIMLPVEVSASADHVATVTTSTDPLLAGRTLAVAAVEGGSRRFSRILLATLTD